MTRNKIPTAWPGMRLLQPGFFRFISVLLLLGGLTACATAPGQSSRSEPVDNGTPEAELAIAADRYNSRNYPGAIREFDVLIADPASSANNRRLAHLGKALVYLGNDPDWYSVDNAKLSLLSAGQVVPAGNEEFSIETDLLMDAVSSVIGTQSKFALLKAKSGNSGAELTELRREIDSLKKDRSELLEEQKALHATIEKLKALTLG